MQKDGRMQLNHDRATKVVLVMLGLLVCSQLLWAAKHSVSKDAQARVVYSGQFKGQVEPCG